MNSRKEFEKWLADYVEQEPKNFNRFMYKLMTVKEAWQEATTRQQKIIDELKAETKELSEVIEQCSGGECYQCESTMPVNLMKRIKELEQQRDELIDALYEYAGVCVPDCGYTLLDVYDPSSTGCITCRQADRACKFLREEIKAGKHE